MAISFFDLGIGERDVQQASADALQDQQAKHLAVTPAVSLSGALDASLKRRRAENALALGAKRLDIAKDAYAYQKAQVPWEIGLGALSGATRLYGGFRALNDQASTAEFQKQSLAKQNEIAATSMQNTTSLVEAYNQQRRLLESQGYRPIQ